MNPWKHYLRWRHSKGYGVHSPYAYRFVTEVLNSHGYGYYAYRDAERMTLMHRQDMKLKAQDVYWLIRMLVFLHTTRVVKGREDLTGADFAAVSLHIPVRIIKDFSGFKFSPSDLLFIKGDDIPASVLQKALEMKIPVLAVNPTKHLQDIMLQPMEHGVLFQGLSKWLLIPREEMSYVSYTMSM